MKKLLLSLSAALFSTLGMAQGQQVIASYDFDNGIPSNWSQSTADATSDGWKGGSATTLSSQYWTIPARSSNFVASNDDGCTNCNKSNDLLISDTLDLSSYSFVHVSFESFFYGASYQGFTEAAELKYSTNGGSTWTSLGDVTPAGAWATQLFDATPAAGNSSVQFALFYGDGGGWLYGLAVDDFTVYVPYNYDATAVSFNTPTPIGMNQGAVDIKGSIKNEGGATLTSMYINYTVNGGSVQTDQVSGISVTPFTTYDFTHATTWTPSATGTYTIKMWASALNGTFDQVNSNDTIEVEVDVVTATTDRTVLAEEFTSSTCAPCASFNPSYNQFLDDNDANTATGRINSIKYQMNWPSPGTDPNYNPEGLARRTYYGITGVPDVVMSGFNIPTSQENYELVRDLPTIATIDATWGNTGNWVRCDVEVNALSDMTGNNKLHIALVEKEITHNVQTNGETVFYDVFRTFMTGSDGLSMGSMNAGDTYNKFELKQISVNSAPAQGSYDFWVGTSNMDVVVFVQDDNTGEVIQSALASYSTSNTDEMDALAKYIAVYPNPANEAAGIELNLIERSNVEIRVVNTIGETVFTSVDELEAGVSKVDVNTASLSAGMYFVNVSVNGTSKTLRLNVAH